MVLPGSSFLDSPEAEVDKLIEAYISRIDYLFKRHCSRLRTMIVGNFVRTSGSFTSELVGQEWPSVTAERAVGRKVHYTLPYNRWLKTMVA